MQISKNKPIRLKGKAITDLYDKVRERDDGCCAVTGKPTRDRPHHIVNKSQGGSDTLDNLITLDWFGFHQYIDHDNEKAIEIIIENFGRKNLIKYFLLGLVAEMERKSQGERF